MPTAKELTLEMMLITENDFFDEKYLRAKSSGSRTLLYFNRLSMFCIYSNESSRKNDNSGTTLT